jgi:hypothetical protein
VSALTAWVLRTASLPAADRHPRCRLPGSAEASRASRPPGLRERWEQLGVVHGPAGASGPSIQLAPTAPINRHALPARTMTALFTERLPDEARPYALARQDARMACCQHLATAPCEPSRRWALNGSRGARHLIICSIAKRRFNSQSPPRFLQLTVAAHPIDPLPAVASYRSRRSRPSARRESETANAKRTQLEAQLALLPAYGK